MGAVVDNRPQAPWSFSSDDDAGVGACMGAKLSDLFKEKTGPHEGKGWYNCENISFGYRQGPASYEDWQLVETLWLVIGEGGRPSPCGGSCVQLTMRFAPCRHCGYEPPERYFTDDAVTYYQKVGSARATALRGDQSQDCQRILLNAMYQVVDYIVEHEEEEHCRVHQQWAQAVHTVMTRHAPAAWVFLFCSNLGDFLSADGFHQEDIDLGSSPLVHDRLLVLLFAYGQQHGVQVGQWKAQQVQEAIEHYTSRYSAGPATEGKRTDNELQSVLTIILGTQTMERALQKLVRWLNDPSRFEAYKDGNVDHCPRGHPSKGKTWCCDSCTNIVHDKAYQGPRSGKILCETCRMIIPAFEKLGYHHRFLVQHRAYLDWSRPTRVRKRTSPPGGIIGGGHGQVEPQVLLEGGEAGPSGVISNKARKSLGRVAGVGVLPSSLPNGTEFPGHLIPTCVTRGLKLGVVQEPTEPPKVQNVQGVPLAACLRCVVKAEAEDSPPTVMDCQSPEPAPVGCCLTKSREMGRLISRGPEGLGPPAPPATQEIVQGGDCSTCTQEQTNTQDVAVGDGRRHEHTVTDVWGHVVSHTQCHEPVDKCTLAGAGGSIGPILGGQQVAVGSGGTGILHDKCGGSPGALGSTNGASNGPPDLDPGAPQPGSPDKDVVEDSQLNSGTLSGGEEQEVGQAPPAEPPSSSQLQCSGGGGFQEEAGSGRRHKVREPQSPPLHSHPPKRLCKGLAPDTPGEEERQKAIALCRLAPPGPMLAGHQGGAGSGSHPNQMLEGVPGFLELEGLQRRAQLRWRECRAEPLEHLTLCKRLMALDAQVLEALRSSMGNDRWCAFLLMYSSLQVVALTLSLHPLPCFHKLAEALVGRYGACLDRGVRGLPNMELEYEWTEEVMRHAVSLLVHLLNEANGTVVDEKHEGLRQNVVGWVEGLLQDCRCQSHEVHASLVRVLVRGHRVLSGQLMSPGGHLDHLSCMTSTLQNMVSLHLTGPCVTVDQEGVRVGEASVEKARLLCGIW